MPPATNSGQALQNLQNFQSSAQTPEQQIQAADQQLGTDAAKQTVTGLQGAISNTTNLLKQVAPTVMGNTQNSLVTSAQANQQISNASTPINQTLSDQTGAYNTANADYADKEQQAEALANANQTAQQNQESYLQSIYSDLNTQEQQQAAAQQAAQQQAEAVREFNASQASAAAASSSPSLVGGSSSGSGYNVAKNSVGGLSFTGPGGKGVTAGQYVAAQGGGVAQLAQLLAESSDPTDRLIVQDLNQGVPVATLQAKYPYVFGGI